ncbi:PQQ-binding-like beta-propeller repeat protein [Dactylosporangium aurantiacum]|uniref:PQQ-binding-like beta-propeller repeat protein n=1 Tax=Dactylosporangium aurantiacum TaxID=35754 RepID=A0A9Q9MLR1_9ACTN|nr:PQQ-binding-like beta-propeller repeat protein [Dactylosporangium aurantiacum]
MPWGLARVAALALVAVIVGGAAPQSTAAPQSAPHGAPHGAPQGAAPSAAGRGEGWTHDGFDAGNSGYNPGERGINAGSVGRLRQRWAVTPAAGAEGCAPALPPPLVAGGRVYILDGEGVTALDAATGRRIWRDPEILDSADFRTLVVSDGLLIVAGTSCYANSDPDGHLYALDAATGARRWHVVQEPPVNELVVDAGTVVASGWATMTNEDTVIAYRGRDGGRRWSRAGAVLAGPVSAAGRVLLHDAHGTAAVTVGGGRELWRTKVRWTPRAASGDRFVAVPDPVGQGDLTGLVAIRAGDGGIAWRRPGTAEDVAIDGRRVYAAAGGTLTALHAGRGTRLWSRTLPGAVGRPVRAGGLLYVTVEGRPLRILSPVTGGDVPGAGRFDHASGHAVVTGGRLYLTDGSTLRMYGP